MSTHNILAISGSLRKDSYNTALLKAFKAQAPEGVNIDIIDISDLPLYNQDLESDFPAAARAIKEKIAAADGILIATPEYNRSISAPLKNVVDWTSRPWGQNSWKRKAIYIVGATMSPLGTALAQNELKKIMLYLDTYVLGQPEFYCGIVQSKFDESGVLTDEGTKKMIDLGLSTFIAFIDKVR